MKKLGLVGLVVSSFVGGVAFVVACGDGMNQLIDAGQADAADCGSCEAPITADRVYRVHGHAGTTFQRIVQSTASCSAGDILLGGGCYAFQEGQTWDGTSLTLPNYDIELEPMQGAPVRAIDAAGTVTREDQAYVCQYYNDYNRDGTADHDDGVVQAVAICFHPSVP